MFNVPRKLCAVSGNTAAFFRLFTGKNDIQMGAGLVAVRTRLEGAPESLYCVGRSCIRWQVGSNPRWSWGRTNYRITEVPNGEFQKYWSQNVGQDFFVLDFFHGRKILKVDRREKNAPAGRFTCMSERKINVRTTSSQTKLAQSFSHSFWVNVVIMIAYRS